MNEMEHNVLDTQIKGITVKIFWQFVAGWTSIVFTLLFTYFSLKAQINDQALTQGRTDAIQDLRIDGIKRDVELQNLQIKDINERVNELKK